MDFIVTGGFCTRTVQPWIRLLYFTTDLIVTGSFCTRTFQPSCYKLNNNCHNIKVNSEDELFLQSAVSKYKRIVPYWRRVHDKTWKTRNLWKNDLQTCRNDCLNSWKLKSCGLGIFLVFFKKDVLQILIGIWHGNVVGQCDDLCGRRTGV